MAFQVTENGVHLTIDATTSKAKVLAMYGDVLAEVERGEGVWNVTLPNGEVLDGSPFPDWKSIPQAVQDFWGKDEVCKQK